jgi:hypothetical protein
MRKKRIVFLILNSKEPIHMEIISTEEEINKVIQLLESSYLFQYFNVIPAKEDK